MKYCTNCGVKHEDHDKFCTSCGAKFEHAVSKAQQEVATNLEVEQNSHRPRNVNSKLLFKGRKSFLIITLILVVGIGTALGILLHKSPKELYLLAELNSYAQQIEEVDSRYGDSIKFQELALEKPSSSETTISGDFNIDSLESDQGMQMVKDLLSESAIKLNTEMSPLTNEGYYSLGLDVGDEKAVDVEFYQSPDQFGMKVPLLYEKFLYLNYDQFGEFMRMADPSYDGPETLNISSLELNELKLTEKEKDYLQERYSKFILSYLKDENFKVEKGIQYEFEGKQMKLRKVTFELSPSETKQLMADFIDYVIGDSDLHNMIVSRAEKVAESAAMFEGTNIEKFNKSEMKTELIKGLKETKEELNNLQFTKGFTSEILINKKEQIIDRKMTMIIEDDSTPIELSILGKNVQVDDQKRVEELQFIIGSEEEDSKAAFEIRNEVEEKKQNHTVENLNMTFYTQSYGEMDEKVDLIVTSDFKGKQGSKQTAKREFEFNASGGEFYDVPSGLTGTIVETKDVNLKKEYANKNYDIQLNVKDEYDSGSVMLSVDTETQLKSKADMPKLDSNSSEGINIAKITEDQIYDIQDEVGTNIMELAEKFGINPEDFWGAAYQDDYSDEAYYLDEAYYDREYLESY